MSDELLEVKPEFMGFQMKGYPGAFPPKVEERLRMIVESPSLHLFSGTSKIGDVRIDLARPEATINQDVFEFLESPDGHSWWKFVIADPPYKIQDRYGITEAYANPTPMNTQRQNILAEYLRSHAENVLWFDLASPCPKGFYRHKTWVYLPGSWHHIRARRTAFCKLTWLKRKGERLA